LVPPLYTFFPSCLAPLRHDLRRVQAKQKRRSSSCQSNAYYVDTFATLAPLLSLDRCNKRTWLALHSEAFFHQKRSFQLRISQNHSQPGIQVFSKVVFTMAVFQFVPLCFAMNTVTGPYRACLIKTNVSAMITVIIIEMLATTSR